MLRSGDGASKGSRRMRARKTQTPSDGFKPVTKEKDRSEKGIAVILTLNCHYPSPRNFETFTSTASTAIGTRKVYLSDLIGITGPLPITHRNRRI